ALHKRHLEYLRFYNCRTTEYCDEMGLKLIAEGIETQEELECICNLHVHYGQGYYLGLPERKFNGVASQALEYLIPKQ
ncbi:EAL domain-containing protein, partial [Holdemanella sp. MSK.7.32]|uniref:EAL domain-containing protein n=1 Tax=Holdemanella sp. MSK.7.32 TaxID=2965273 RepID=UPI00210CCD7A